MVCCTQWGMSSLNPYITHSKIKPCWVIKPHSHPILRQHTQLACLELILLGEREQSRCISSCLSASLLPFHTLSAVWHFSLTPHTILTHYPSQHPSSNHSPMQIKLLKAPVCKFFDVLCLGVKSTWAAVYCYQTSWLRPLCWRLSLDKYM